MLLSSGVETRNALCYAQADLVNMLAPQFEEQLRQDQEEDSFVQLIRLTIEDKFTGQRPSVEEHSQALHMSPRTLQRRLQEQVRATGV